MFTKQDMEKRSGGGKAELTDPQFAKQYPALYWYLAARTWEDGSRREQATLLVIPEAGYVKAFVRDRATGKCCWVVSPSLTELYAVLNGALSDTGHAWKDDRREEGQPAKSSHVIPPNGVARKGVRK